MGNLLAVDAGGTSTRAIVLTTSGECLGYGRAGSGNPISSGTEHAAREVASAVTLAMHAAGADAIDSTPVLAMAGSRAHVSSEWIGGPLAAIGVSGTVRFESDLLATFCSGAWEAFGYAIVAGTGAAAIRVVDGRPNRAADGLGWLLGDDGSGFWIGRRVVRAVSDHLDDRGQTTALTPLLLDMLGIPLDLRILDPEDGRVESLKHLVDEVYALRPIELARFAPLVFAAGDDPLAAAIIADARAGLRTTLASIDSADVRGPVVCGGGVLGTLGLPVDGLAGVTEIRKVADGAVGAAVLALRDNGVNVDRELFERVTRTLAVLRG
ncbi:N-acetylglucosamine kinase [Planctomonas sp. JC2975]|uniref:N-acetylglucosamine kinase n=1 Tax=Planctomonas sp. JC2975 TaxID=2729626 RepID=UPI001475C150|nr:BadF/BadG/BcrA/BcrD ATPase family protein [Planctomonas sp. JC2975]NNC11292.1 N-acetylglucosamine kinase [Planctomonas sp. JC2975]